jgi:hypothetical protein
LEQHFPLLEQNFPLLEQHFERLGQFLYFEILGQLRIRPIDGPLLDKKKKDSKIKRESRSFYYRKGKNAFS